MFSNFNFNSQSNPGSSVPYGGKSSSYLDFFNLSYSSVIIGIVLLFILVIIVMYYYGILDLNPKYKPNNEQIFIEGDNNKHVELLFFFTNWCPHCKTAKPVWEELKKEYENKTVNGYKVIFTEVDCTEETAEVDAMMNKYNVEGYPTIKLLKDGQVIEYDAKPSKDTLVQFLNTVV
jgi:thiol-disulfide isomerase/thioredoxin